MEWTTVQCAHCQTTYKHRLKARVPQLAAELRKGVPCPHCYHLQPGDLSRHRWRRVGCLWLGLLPFFVGLAIGYGGGAVAGILLLAAAVSVVLEGLAARGRHKDRAIILMEAGELLDPDENPESLYQLAGRADPEQAARLLYRVAALTPERLEIWTELAQCLASQDRVDEARTALERALILDPDSPQVWQAKAGLAMSAENFDEALRHLELTLTLAPEDPTVWANRAMVLQRLKRLPEAKESAARAVELDPSNPISWLNRARLQEQAGDPEASESYRQFLARAEDVGAEFYRGVDLAAKTAEVRGKLGE